MAKILKGDAIAEGAAPIVGSIKPIKAKPEKPAKAKAEKIAKVKKPKVSSPYRKIILSRSTVQYTVPSQVRDSALKALGLEKAAELDAYAVKVVWDPEAQTIVAKFVPIAEAGFAGKE